MSDAFEEIQAIKIKRNCLREKLQKRKRERNELFTLTSSTSLSSSPSSESQNITGNQFLVLMHPSRIFKYKLNINNINICFK